MSYQFYARGQPGQSLVLLRWPAVHSTSYTTRAPTTGTIQTAYPWGSRMFAIIWSK